MNKKRLKKLGWLALIIAVILFRQSIILMSLVVIILLYTEFGKNLPKIIWGKIVRETKKSFAEKIVPEIKKSFTEKVADKVKAHFRKEKKKNDEHRPR